MLFGAGKGRAPVGHNSVADIFVDDAVVMPYRLRHHGHITVQHIDQSGRRHALAKCGEPPHIAKQDAHLAARAFGVGHFGPIEQPGNNTRIDIFAKGVADLCFESQFADHAVEGLGQPADLVARRNRDHSIEGTALDCGCAQQQAAHRTHQAESDGRRNGDAERRGDRQ
jgi:hypothetical protein